MTVTSPSGISELTSEKEPVKGLPPHPSGSLFGNTEYFSATTSAIDHWLPGAVLQDGGQIRQKTTNWLQNNVKLSN